MKGGIIAGVVVVLAASEARAGNEEGVLFGAAAEMSAGAVTATVEDGAALWYNPAGLAGADVQQLDVSGTAYTFRRYSAPDLIRVPGMASVAGEVTELMSVAASLAIARRFGRVSVAVGLFTPRASDQVFRATARIPGDVTWLVATSQLSSEYAAGAGLAWSPHPRLRLGAALFVHYASDTGAVITQASRGSGPGTQEFANVAALYDFKRAGVELSLGAQWRPVDALRLGIAIRPPGANVYASETTDATGSGWSGAAMAGARPEARSESARTSGFEFTQRSPLRVRLGVAVERPRFTVSLDGDFALALRSEDRDDRVWSGHWNLRLGGVVRVTERLRVGAGLFTDRAADREAQRPLDFYGGTVGVEWGTLHLLRDAARDRLTFVTSLSARYAYGSALIEGVQTVAGSVGSTPSQTELDVHELAIYLGSTFRF